MRNLNSNLNGIKYRYLKVCGMALDDTTTYEEMLSELDMTHDDYIKAVLTSIVRPNYF